MGPAADFLAPGDRIHQIDGIATVGLTNAHVLNVLLSGDQAAVVEIEYCLPDYSKCCASVPVRCPECAFGIAPPALIHSSHEIRFDLLFYSFAE